MKYLFLCLISFSVFAQFKVEVKNLDNVITHGGTFTTSLEAEQWILEQEKQVSWGKPERLVPQSECTESELASALELIPELVENSGAMSEVITPAMARLPKNFSTLITNITDATQANATADALISAGRKAREACNRVLDLIGGFNLLPGRTSENINSMVTTFDLAKQHLQDGRPGEAKKAIIDIPVDGVLVTQPMKDLALAQLAGY